jgi:hypothetical protein
MNSAERWSPGARQHAALDASIAEDLSQEVETESGLLAQNFTIKLRKSQTRQIANGRARYAQTHPKQEHGKRNLQTHTDCRELRHR